MSYKKLLSAACFSLALLFSANSFSESQILLQRGDITVTQQDLERYIDERIPADRRHDILRRPGMVRDMIENIYVIRTLSNEAEQSSVAVMDPEQLAWQMAFERDRVLMTAYLDFLVDQVFQSMDWEQAAREVYIADGDQFFSPERVRASHILIRTEDRSAEEAMSLINQIRERAVAGEDFAALAVEFSEDVSSKNNSGSLGTFGKGRMVAPFEVAVFAMRTPGQISDVIETDFGYHIIQLHEHLPPVKLSFEQVRRQIEAQLREQMSNKLRQDHIVETRSATDIEVDLEQIEAIETRLRNQYAQES